MKRFPVALGLMIALSSCTAGSPVLAHSWYPADCCSDRDCWPMGVDSDAREPDPIIVPGGFRTHDGIFISQGETRPSRDGRYHVCRSQGEPDGPVISTSKGMCLFVPQPGS